MGSSRTSVIVVGASAGGVEALRELVARLQPGIRTPIVVALHMAGTRVSALPRILAWSGPLPARFAEDRDALEPGTILVAPPGLQTVIARDGVRLTFGPRERAHLRTIDPLFRSAAESFGSAATGVILSGSLDDGVSGLGEIVRAGGRSLVQDPDEARQPWMPLAAIARVQVDAVLPAEALAIELMAADLREVIASPSP